MLDSLEVSAHTFSALLPARFTHTLVLVHTYGYSKGSMKEIKYYKTGPKLYIFCHARVEDAG